MCGGTPRAPNELGLEPWWPRWISVDWGFEHPSAVYWHAARPDGAVVTYREFVANHLSPRMLAQAIAERSLDARRALRAHRRNIIFRRTHSRAAPRNRPSPNNLATCWRKTACRVPAPADDDRVGGWMLLYQMLEQEQWVIAIRARS